MFSVYQHWDPLKVCVVGRSWPPEFYSWIAVPHVRSLFEKIATETEEDFQKIIKKLEQFGVKVLRPELPSAVLSDGKFTPPPMTPRDYTVMIGDVFYAPHDQNSKFVNFYKSVKDRSWPDCVSLAEFHHLPVQIQRECKLVHNMDAVVVPGPMDNIIEYVRQQGNDIGLSSSEINGAMVTRIGRDLYFGTNSMTEDIVSKKRTIDQEFVNTRNHVINTGGHSDGTFCPVCPGLIISLFDVPTYKDTFPDWEVVYLPGQSWSKVRDFLVLKNKNKGKWWIPGFEHDQDVINTVETWLDHWVGYVEETVFDVNMLIIDPKNVIVFNYNQQVFDALQRFGITPHVVPFRHRYFWDGGVHCVTSDLHREGTIKDYFPGRN